MNSLLLIVFAAAFVMIALEGVIKISKSAVAVLMAFFFWAAVFVGHMTDKVSVESALGAHLADISQVIFFLLGAMMIVEIIDSYRGFCVIKKLIRTSSKRALLWIVSFIAFFASSMFDNVTTSIVMVTLLRQLLDDKHDRIFFASMVIIAANAGGAWTPIGDVTTTMLWIRGCISSAGVMSRLFLPSLVSMLVPLACFSFYVKGNIASTEEQSCPHPKGSHTVLYVGMAALLMAPVLKSFFDIAPFLSALCGAGVLWLYTDIRHKSEPDLSVPRVLKKIDISTLLFLVGVLLAVSALDTQGLLLSIESGLKSVFKSDSIVIAVLGVLSAVVDNVPLTAAAMGMYDLGAYTVNNHVWLLTAYCVGTGGSLLLLGSAAGVVVAGMEELSFGWYLKKISLPVLFGYLAGIGFFMFF